MIILSIESSSQAGGVAVMDELHLIAEYRLDIKTRHAERLMVCIDQVLKQCTLTISDCDAIAVSMGPGSFTGLRVGLATAKGLATAHGLPLIMVPTLEVMAASFPFSKAFIAPFMDARRGEVYTALFDMAEGKPIRFQEDHAVTPKVALEEIIAFQKQNPRPVVFSGDGAIKYRSLIEEKMGTKGLFATKSTQFASAASLAELAITRYEQGKMLASELAHPAYIRASSAEIARAQNKSQQ